MPDIDFSDPLICQTSVLYSSTLMCGRRSVNFESRANCHALRGLEPDAAKAGVPGINLARTVMAGDRVDELPATHRETVRSALNAAFGSAQINSITPIAGGASGAFPHGQTEAPEPTTEAGARQQPVPEPFAGTVTESID